MIKRTSDIKKKPAVNRSIANNIASNKEEPLKKGTPGILQRPSAGFSFPSLQLQFAEDTDNHQKERKPYVNPIKHQQPISASAHQIQRNPFGMINVSHNVQLIPQPTRYSCWAAALAMVANFRDGASHTPASIAAHAFMDLATGYEWPDIQNAVEMWNLSETAPAGAMPPYWADLLEDHGPLWIVEVGAPYHAIVLAGMFGSGSMDATQVTIYNPWPPNTGAVEYQTFEDFEREFNLGAGAGAMIVHA